MKILFCTQYYQTQNVGPSHLVDMVLYFNQLNKECKVKILTPDTQENSDIVFKLPVLIPQKLLFLDFLIYNWAYYRAIKKIKKSFKPDIILFGNSIMGVLTSLFLSRSTKIIGFINDYFYLETNISHFRFSKRWFYLFLMKKVQFLSILCSHKTLVCSLFLKDFLQKSFPSQAYKIMTLYQGIDVKSIPYTNRNYPFEQPVKIVFIKKLSEIGGLDILVEALSLIKNYTFELQIVSLDCDKIAVWQQENPHIHFTFLGLLKPKQVYQILEKSDILCVPSRKESFGIVNIEGLASGIAVVSVKTGGIPEVLTSFGWLAEKNDTNFLSQKLLECIEAPPSVLVDKSKNGRHFVEQNFDYQYLSKQLLHICENLSSNPQ